MLRRHFQSLLITMERPALFVGDAEEGAATLKEAEVRVVRVPRPRVWPFQSRSEPQLFSTVES